MKLEARSRHPNGDRRNGYLIDSFRSLFNLYPYSQNNMMSAIALQWKPKEMAALPTNDSKSLNRNVMLKREKLPLNVLNFP